jgi:benzoate transport
MKDGRPSNAFAWLDALPFNRFHTSTLIISCLVIMTAGFNLQILSYAMPLITKEWGLSPVQGGAMVSYGFFGLMVGALIFGPVADRIGRKRAIMVALSLFGILGGATSFAGSYRGLCVLRFFTGIGIGGAFPLTVALLSEFSPSRTRARMVTAAVSGFTFGWVVAASLSVVVIPSHGWRAAFQWGIAPLLLLPFVALFLPESVRFLAGRGRTEEALRQMEQVRKMAGITTSVSFSVALHTCSPGGRGNLYDLFRGRLASMTLLLWLCYLLNTIALYGLASWLPSILVKQGFSLAKSYSYAMAQAGGAALGGLLLGFIMDRFGRKPGLILTYFFGGLSIVIFGSIAANFSLYVAGAATGVFVVGTPTALNVVSSEIYPTLIRSTGVASTQAIGRIGSIVGPLLGGFLQTSGFGFSQFFFILAVPCFLCMFLAMLFPLNVKGETLEGINERLSGSVADRG